jgi:hypothetical protein
MWRVIPEALALPSPTPLETTNRDLEREIAERRQAEQALEERTQALLAAQDARSLFDGVPVGLPLGPGRALPGREPRPRAAPRLPKPRIPAGPPTSGSSTWSGGSSALAG